MAKDNQKSPVKALGSSLKKSAWASICESVLIVVVGIMLIAMPVVMFETLRFVFGVALIAIGIYQGINYFIVKGQNDVFDNSLLTGVISILVGAALLLYGNELAVVFRIVIGILLIYGSLVRFNAAIKMHGAGISVWGWILAAAILMLISGIIVTFYMNVPEGMQVIGGLIIVGGVMGLISDTIFIREVDEVEKKIASN